MTETVTLRLASHDNYKDWVYESVTGADNPIGADLSSTAYASVYLIKGSYAETYVYYSFDTSAIPEGSIITGVSCTVKMGSVNRLLRSADTIALVSGENQKNVTVNTSVSSELLQTFDGGAWNYDEIKNIRLQRYVKRGSRIDINSGVDAKIYAAELTVTYDMPLPSDITDFTAAVSGGVVNLSWTGADNADGYNIYRDGALIGTTTGTTFSDTTAKKYLSYTYSAAAYNSYGESAAASAEVSISGGDVIADLIFDRTSFDLINGTAKGNYNADDLNRVAVAVNYVSEMFAQYGYNVPEAVAADWKTNDLPRKSKIDEHHAKTLAAIGLILYPGKPDKIPETLDKLTIEGANAIERALYELIIAGNNIPDSWYYSGELYGGEI